MSAIMTDGVGGWFQKIAVFGDVQYFIYVDMGGLVRKDPKMYWRT